MSFKLHGVYIFENSINLQEQIDLSFLVALKAIQNKIGIKQGGNVDLCVINKRGIKQNEISFELTDDLLDINAECLLIGDGVRVNVGGTKISNEESLCSRMLRVQNSHFAPFNNKKLQFCCKYLDTTNSYPSYIGGNGGVT